MTTRRSLFRNSLLGGMGLGLPQTGLANIGSTPNVIFITCFGGWDATRTLYPAFDNPIVDMEGQAERWSIGNLQLVDHPQRPALRHFFQSNHHRTSLIHGILSPSVSHQACLQLMRTGFPTGHPDWPTLLARELFFDAPIPHLGISGDVFAGLHSDLLTRMGQGKLLASLLDDSLFEWSDIVLGGVDAQLIIAEQEVRLRRMGRLAESANSDVFQSMMSAAARAQYLKERHQLIDWESDGSLLGDCLLAVDVLEQGISPCISIGHSALWDSHSNNEVYQHWLWEELFSALAVLFEELDLRQGSAMDGNSGMTLAEQTTVIVLSEMGRAPRLNSSLGKDHWPYTSAMIIGERLQESRVYGGYGANFQGLPIDLNSGELFSGGQHLSVQHFGSSILQLFGLDGADLLDGTEALLL